MRGSHANASPFASTAGGRHDMKSVRRDVPVRKDVEDGARRVGWIVAVPLTAFVIGAAVGAAIAVAAIRMISR